jgi:DNA polymerase elongation subunit (family B)
MYRNVYYDQREQLVKLFTWDKNGQRIVTDCSYNPYIWIESKKPTNQKSLFNTDVMRRDFSTQWDRNKYIRDSGRTRVFENINCEHQFLIDMFWKEHQSDSFSQHPLKVLFIDIETYSPDAFPIPSEAKDTINVITVYDSLSHRFITWGLGELDKTIDNCDYVHCETEVILLENFLNYLERDYPDVITGWNTEFFDIPYIINRLYNILGEDAVKRLSPVRNVFKRAIMGQFGREQDKYYIKGVACLDYLDVYKKFSQGLRESYKLDAIGEYELGEKKIDYGNTNLSSLADDDWQTFVEYNIQDVNLIVKMEDKLRYLELLRMLAYVGCTPLESAMGTLSTITGAVIMKGREKGVVIPTFVKDSAIHQRYEGAYVGEPQRGFQENILSFDANSLYPNTMISLNLSPETKIGTITHKDDTGVTIRHVNGQTFDLKTEAFMKFVQDEQIAISKAKVLFTQARKGIIPEIVDRLYQQRVEIKKELKKHKLKFYKLTKTDAEYNNTKKIIDRLDIKQFTIKILINTVYGYFGNKHAPIGDSDIARSITLTGQAVIKQSNKILQHYIHELSGDEKTDPIVYNDTDSSYISIKSIVKALNIPFVDSSGKITDQVYTQAQRIEDHLNQEITKWSNKSLNSKDSRFVFKRECICDTGVFLQKKRYVLHVLDDEGIPVNKFKYTGVEVVRSTMPSAIKPYVKKIIETMMSTKELSKTDKVFLDAYETFKSLPIEEIAFVMGVKEYDKYAKKCSEFNTVKGMPIHTKAAYFYNLMVDRFNVSNDYEKISNGDKIRYFYVKQPNKYGLNAIGYKYYMPEEFKDVFEPDTELMFEKIIFNIIERFYDAVGWKMKQPGKQVQTDLFELLGV